MKMRHSRSEINVEHVRLISVSLQFGQFVGDGAYGGADLRLVVIRGDEEAQAGGAVRHCRRQDRMDVDAAVEQGARQAQGVDQAPPIAGKQRAPFAPVAVKAPAWWAEARIPLDDAPSPG